MSSSSAATSAAPEVSGGMEHKQILAILGGLMAGMFLAALDQTVVSTAIRTIGDDLHGLKLQAWVTTAYLITSTIATPLYGKLSDIYGRRPFFMLAISLFVIGSLACSFATSMYMLAAFRAFQGLGAGGLFSLSLAIMGDIMPPRQRAKYQGYFLAVFGTSSVIGPLIGGLFAGTHSILGIAGWRWVFLINVPIGLIALAIVARVLHIPHTSTNHRIDWWGAVALIIGLVPLLTVAEQGRDWGWGSPGVLILLVVGVLALVGFVLVEIRMQAEALIPMRLFRNVTFSVVQVAGMLVGMAMFGAILTIPLFLQIVRGATPTQSGLQMLSMTIGLMLAAIVSGQITSRTGRYKIFPQIGMALVMVGALLLTFELKIDTPNLPMWGMIFLVGFGIGLCMQSLTLATQNAVPAKDMGVATSSATFFRQTGGTIGVAVFLSLLFSLLPDKISGQISAVSGSQAFRQAAAQQAGSTDPAKIQQTIAGFGASMQNDTSFLQRISPTLARPFQQGFVDSMHPVFFAAAIVALVAFIVLWFMKETPLRTISALQERQNEAAAAVAAQVAADAQVDGSADGQADHPSFDHPGDGGGVAVLEKQQVREQAPIVDSLDPAQSTNSGEHLAADPDVPVEIRLPGLTQEVAHPSDPAVDHGRHRTD
ncbi:MAG: MFS transporter [Actinomycetota bacterium]|nr:MFS transporter [Actinomycetota bacterium]